MSYGSDIDRSLSEMLVLSVKVGWVPGNDFRGCGSQSRGINFDFFNWCFLQDDIVLVLVLVFLICHYGSCILSRVFSALVCLLCLFYLSSCTLSVFLRCVVEVIRRQSLRRF